MISESAGLKSFRMLEMTIVTVETATESVELND